MPLYEYQCQRCNTAVMLRRLRSRRDWKLPRCDKCSGSIQRVIGKPGVIFKGHGFYSTDNGEARNESNGHGD
jgi:putative FmdB family regulatory protein